jgi:hypothetical protein
MMVPLWAILVIELLGAQVPDVISAELKPETLEAFNQYIRATEARVDKEVAHPDAFLYVEGLPQERREKVVAALNGGEIFMEELKGPDASGREPRIPGGLIHHWIGDFFVSGATVQRTLDLVQDYDHHQDYFKPELVQSRLISRNENDFRFFYRLRKHKIITVTLNTEHAVHYTRLDDRHWCSRSVSTRIAELENADKPNQREKPAGHDSGFLWRINSYWRFEERDGAVYVECESISLTRDLPFGLGWIIKPFVTEIPKETLQMTLGSIRSALLARIAPSPTP